MFQHCLLSDYQHMPHLWKPGLFHISVYIAFQLEPNYTADNLIEVRLRIALLHTYIPVVSTISTARLIHCNYVVLVLTVANIWLAWSMDGKLSRMLIRGPDYRVDSENRLPNSWSLQWPQWCLLNTKCQKYQSRVPGIENTTRSVIRADFDRSPIIKARRQVTGLRPTLVYQIHLTYSFTRYWLYNLFAFLDSWFSFIFWCRNGLCEFNFEKWRKCLLGQI
jgi:hypothetical protein